MYYKYSVLSETGNEINGVGEGPYKNMKQSLKEKNYFLLSLEPDILRSIKSCVERKKIKAQDLAVFFEDMANMLKTGIAINEAVIALRESSTVTLLTKALEKIEDDLASGFSLAKAFETTKVFPWLVLNMLKVGEKSGNLEKVLEDLSRNYSREADFLLELKNALIYPVVILSMLVGIMFYVSFNVIPHLEALLPIASNGYVATKLLLGLSHFLKDFWYICPFFPIAVIFIYYRLKKGSNEWTVDYYCKIPVIGELAKDMAFSTFFSNLALLQRNGISIINSLALIEETTSYKFLAKKILKVKDFITSGLCLWQAFEKDSFFPGFVYYSVRKGEEMGSLDAYLESLSKYYFSKVSRRIRVILSLIQPVLLIFCAGVLLFLVSAFIVPVYGNLSNIAGGNVKF